MNKKYYLSIKKRKYIDNKIEDYLILKEKSLGYVKEIMSLNNRYKLLLINFVK